MKCLLITSYFPPTIGGSSTVYGTLFKYGKNNISILTAKRESETGQTIPRDNSPNIHLIKYLQPPNKKCYNTAHAIWLLLRYDIPTHVFLLIRTIMLVRRENFDLVCLGELQTLGWLQSAIKRLTTAKVILYIHGEELTTKVTSRFFGKRAKQYLNNSNGIVCVSNFTKNTLTKQFNVPEKNIKLITNGIDLNTFGNRNQSDTITNSIVRKFKTKNCFLIFSAGRLIERKGFDYAIEAMKIVLLTHPHVRLVIAGEGNQLKFFKEKIISLGLEQIVIMAGLLPHKELINFYSNCDIFLMPNRELVNGDTEGFGLVFLEANAFKKPVIGGNAGGAVDAIVNGKTGFLVDSSSVTDIANAVNKLVENDELREKMGKDGYEWAKQNDAKQKVNLFINYCETISSEN